ncbi:MAG: helix-turn-helix domain-containing protein, partial [Phycisphaerae bacterium]|nr:helix-turn-helix domain-containing protein [Phycisphaerae bacterium]
TFNTWDDGYDPPAKAIEPAPGRMPLADPKCVCCSLAEAEEKAIRHALEMTGFNRTAAAKLLDIHRSTLLRKIRLMGLDSRF